MKYWLIAVSSDVRTSFRSSMISGLPSMVRPPRFGERPSCRDDRAPGGDLDVGLVVLVDEVFDGADARTAIGAGAAHGGDVLGAGGSGQQGGSDGPLVHRMARTHDHDVKGT